MQKRKSIIAKRTFRIDGTKKKLSVVIEKPIKTGKDYSCSCRILGSKPYSYKVFGVDSLQALYLALECIRLHLSGRALRWLGGPVNETGLYRVITVHDHKLNICINKTVDKTIESWARKMIATKKSVMK